MKTTLQNFLQFFVKRYDRLYIMFQGIFVDEETDAANIRKHENLIRPLFLLASIAFGVAIVVLLIDIADFFSQEKSERALGPFGDFFGGVVNPIFTFLTFFGLVITIVIQRMELRLARIEYKETADALKTQAMETTFFNLLDLHHKIVEGLKLDFSIFPETDEERTLRLRLGAEARATQVVTGRNIFEAIVQAITKGSPSPSVIAIRYKFLNSRHNHVIGHYFRNLYHILKVVDGYSDISIDEKRKYASIVRAQLSSNELILLFFNCLDGIVDRGQFKNLIIRYRLLEHIPFTSFEGAYQAANIRSAVASQDQVEQYFEEKLILVRAQEFDKGAFGRNGQIRIAE